MYLLTRTNGALLEWLTGPIRYREVGPLSEGLRTLSEGIVPPIGDLLAAKRTTPELGEGEPVTELDAFIREELERHAQGFSGRGRPETDPGGEVREALNALFRTTVEAAWTG